MRRRQGEKKTKRKRKRKRGREGGREAVRWQETASLVPWPSQVPDKYSPGEQEVQAAYTRKRYWDHTSKAYASRPHHRTNNPDADKENSRNNKNNTRE